MPGHRRSAAVEGEQTHSDARNGHRLLKVALLGGGVALLVSEDLRNRVLDVLFGAEEEFDYSSLTEPPPPPAEHSPSEPWVRSSEQFPEPEAPAALEPAPSERAEAAAASDDPVRTAPEAPAHTDPDASGDAPAHSDPEAAGERPVQSGPEASANGQPGDEPAAGVRVTISPSPAAWRAAEHTESEPPRSNEKPSAGTPPSPPPGWWAPIDRSIDPLDG